jgi:hypothetical protein
MTFVALSIALKQYCLLLKRSPFAILKLFHQIDSNSARRLQVFLSALSTSFAVNPPTFAPSLLCCSKN